MSKKVVLVAGILLAVGAAAAVSAPSLRGQRHGSLLDDLADGVGRATHQISQAIGVSDENATPSREERRGRRAKRGREEIQDEAADSAEGDSIRPKREMGKGTRAKEQIARQDDEDDGEAGEPRRGRRWAANDRAEAGEPRKRGAFSADFGRLDRNGDGVVDPVEFVQAETERMAARTRQFFERFDANGDGKVTREEFQSAARQRVTALDADDESQAPVAARNRGTAR